jgi:hypothetical protein
MIWAILIIVGFAILCMWGMADMSSKYFKPRDAKGDLIYTNITKCNSFAAWSHWKQRVQEFEKEYPTSTGYIKGLNKALVEAAERISKQLIN